MKNKETNNEKKTQEADFLFSCGNFQKMAEMMKNFCPGEDSTIDCCSMMRRMTELSKGGEPKKTQETQKPSKDGENA